MEYLPTFFKRRFDHHKFEKVMRRSIGYVIAHSKSFDDFEARLFSLALINYFHDRHNIDLTSVSSEDLDEIIQYLSEVYDGLIQAYYRNARKK